MIRLVNDEKFFKEYEIRKIENQIQDISLFLEKRPVFLSLAKTLFEVRLGVTKFWEGNSVIYLKEKKRMPWSTVISEYKNDTIFYNPRIYRGITYAAIIGNIVHETLHHFGFGHDYYSNKFRKYQTPYYLGYLYEFLAIHYDVFEYNEETDLDSLVLKWRDYINNEIH